MRQPGFEMDPKQELPDSQLLAQLYGPLDQPVLFGLDTCQAYRQLVPKEHRYTAPAGLFNTGTNALEFHLSHNSGGPTKWQAPWGKHRVPARRLHRAAANMEQVNQTEALPIVILRDPYFWMQSMCKQPYAAHWRKGPHRCPNLVPTPQDYQRWKNIQNETTFRVKVIFDRDDVVWWDSLIDLWVDYYRQYYEADYPRIMIRFEDLLWHAPKVLRAISECLGTTLDKPFAYQTKAAKSHGSGTDFWKALLKTGNVEKRLHGLTVEDLEYSLQHMDTTLLEVFRYGAPSVKDLPNATDSR